jgi:hypothetical protein
VFDIHQQVRVGELRLDGQFGLMKKSVVGACALILIAHVAGSEGAQSQETVIAKVHAWVKDTMGLVRSYRWMRETGIAKIHPWVKIGGKTCMLDHFHDGGGNGPTRAQAERAAIRSWAAFTAWEYGDRWGRYSVAVSRSMTCSQRSGSWSCAVKARPCRPY